MHVVALLFFSATREVAAPRFGVLEGVRCLLQQLQATTPAPSPSEEARASSSSPSPSPSAAGSAQAWRRVASATTQRPQVTLSLPQYSIDCAEGLSCSETIAVDAATQPPTFKPYPQDVLDKFLRDFAHAQRLPDQHARPTEGSVERATNRLANLYLEHEGAAGAEGEAEIEGEASGEEEGEEEGGARGRESRASRAAPALAQQHHHPYDDRDGWCRWSPFRGPPARWPVARHAHQAAPTTSRPTGTASAPQPGHYADRKSRPHPATATPQARHRTPVHLAQTTLQPQPLATATQARLTSLRH
ncbi:Uncharacterized protein GBIM_19917 [Gryllus bimaculatus]|nr:Uncharacterized protein GBIM_19917 [Gryllus bimaculatus]